MGNICETCYHRKDVGSVGNAQYTLCELDNIFHFCTSECRNYNNDVSKDKICLNCKNFIGGGDWGLSCLADYCKITVALNPACKNFMRKDNKE